MDIEDDDAFLYGESSSPPPAAAAPTTTAAPAAAEVKPKLESTRLSLPLFSHMHLFILIPSAPASTALPSGVSAAMAA